MPTGNRVTVGVAGLTALVLAMTASNSPALGQVAGSGTAKAAPPKPDWLQDAGADLRIRVSGDVVDETGAPVDGCRLAVSVISQFDRSRLPVIMDGNRFRFWVPVGDIRSFTVFVSARSPDGSRTGSESISMYELRQAATDGLKLTIKPPERVVEVMVTDAGNPVPEAEVLAEIGQAPFTARTDQKGIARFPFRNRDTLSYLTAWTDDLRIGGFAFNRNPPRDPSGSQFTIELDKCRPQVIRIVNDEDGTPVSRLRFCLTVGAGRPNNQFFGATPEREMRTDEKGEAVYRWFPDWKTHGSYIELLDPRWVKVGNEDVDGVIVTRVKKSRFGERKRVIGQVAVPDGSPAGFCVEVASFQGEERNRSDVLHAFTDENGKFAADVLPGSTYCVCVNDARYVSDIIDLIPYDADADKVSSPSLKISEGRPVEVTVTAGPAKTPVPYQQIELRTYHRYSWNEDGKVRNGMGARRWWVTTDEQGKARTFALPESSVVGYVLAPNWPNPRRDTPVSVKADGVTQLELHNEAARLPPP